MATKSTSELSRAGGTTYDWMGDAPTVGFSGEEYPVTDLIGSFQLPSGAGYTKEGYDPFSGGALYDPDSGFDPKSIFGPSATTGPFKDIMGWLPEVKSEGFKTYDPFNWDDLKTAGFKDTSINPWTGMAFKGGGYMPQVKGAVETYRKGVSDILEGYYGTAGMAWRSDPGAYGGWIPWGDQTGLLGQLGVDPTMMPDYTVPRGGTSVLGKYYEDWQDYGTMEGAGMFDRTGGYSDEQGASPSVYHQLKSGAISPTDDTGEKIKSYLSNRSAVAEKYLGTSDTALQGWDPSDTSTYKPTLMDDQGVQRDLTIESTDADFDLALGTSGAPGKYTEGSAMHTYALSLKGLQLQMKDLTPIETGDYAGLYEGHKEILEGLFGSGTHIDPGESSALQTARSSWNTTATEFYTDSDFGEQALTTAIAKTATDSASAKAIWDDAQELQSKSITGLADYSKQDLITEGFIDDEFNLLFESEANSANTANNSAGVAYDDALEQESELAYHLRKLVTGDTGAVATYETAYDTYVNTKVENMRTAHDDFQSDFEGAASEFAAGQISLKERAAKQKGLRSGTMNRIRKQLEMGIAQSYGEDKLDWEEFNRLEQQDFEGNIESIAASLVTTWEGAFGPAGSLDVAEGVRDDQLISIFGSYDYTDEDGIVHYGIPHTADSILQIMQAGYAPGTPITITADFGNGLEEKTITPVQKGNYGTAFDTHKTAKMGRFGTLAQDKGFSPGEDAQFGTGDDDQWYVGFDAAGNPNAAGVQGATVDEYGWATGNMPAAKLDAYSAMTMPIEVAESLESYSTEGLYGTELRGWMGEFEKQLGGQTPSETGIMTEETAAAYATGTTPTMAELYPLPDEATGVTGVAGGKFGEVTEEAIEGKEGLEIEAGLAKSRDLAGMVDTFTGTGEASEKGIASTFKTMGVNAQTARLDDYKKLFKESGAESIEAQVDVMTSAVSGEAQAYFQNIQDELASPEFGKIISGKWHTDMPLAVMTPRAEETWKDVALTLALMTIKNLLWCIPENTKIDTPKGKKRIDDIRAGDYVIGYNGSPIKVMQKHEYAENPKVKRFLRFTLDNGSTVDLCDMHKMENVRSKEYKVGDSIGGKIIVSIKSYGNVNTSYDLVTGDSGYRISGVPVNSMVGEMSLLVGRVAEKLGVYNG